MSIAEIEAEILELPVEQVDELLGWLETYRAKLDLRAGEDLNEERFNSLISEAYASGEAAPLTQDDLDLARQTVRDRLAA